MSTNQQISIIIAEIQEELVPIHHFRSQIAQLSEETINESLTELEIRGIASILHDFYNAIERIFRRIAHSIDKDVPMGENWHKQLLDRMVIAIPAIRISVISKKLRDELHEYLRFRHLFRNIYGHELKISKIEHFIKDFDKISTDFVVEIQDFLEWLNNLSK